MLIAKVIYADLRKKPIICEDCEMQYPQREYKLLFNSSKIKYFNITHPNDKKLDFIFCHDCLFDNLKEVCPNDIIEFKVLTQQYEYFINYYPEQVFLEIAGDDAKDGEEGEGIEGFLASLE